MKTHLLCSRVLHVTSNLMNFPPTLCLSHSHHPSWCHTMLTERKGFSWIFRSACWYERKIIIFIHNWKVDGFYGTCLVYFIRSRCWDGGAHECCVTNKSLTLCEISGGNRKIFKKVSEVLTDYENSGKKRQASEWISCCVTFTSRLFKRDFLKLLVYNKSFDS